MSTLRLLLAIILNFLNHYFYKYFVYSILYIFSSVAILLCIPDALLYLFNDLLAAIIIYWKNLTHSIKHSTFLCYWTSAIFSYFVLLFGVS